MTGVEHREQDARQAAGVVVSASTPACDGPALPLSK